jgi:hypothetical protein
VKVRKSSRGSNADSWEVPVGAAQAGAAKQVNASSKRTGLKYAQHMKTPQAFITQTKKHGKDLAH